MIAALSGKLANVLSGLASSKHTLLIKTINIDPAPAVAAPEPVIPMVSSVPMMMQPNPMNEEMSRVSAQQAFASRYGISQGAQNLGGIAYRGLGESAPPPVYTPQPGVQPGAAAAKGGLPTVLDEKLLKITLNLYVVKLLPSK